ncbi:excinuclease ABC subunit UvrA, partial [Candidatus Falkowbacteria bacterium CG10_big_fil_rev_8_21_14_0_10_37_6]
LTIKGASEHNLKNIDINFPLGKFIALTGVSGSGKSTLMTDILSKALAKKFYRAKVEPGEHKKIKGLEHIDKVITIDQSPIGRTPRSNPATYTGAFTYIRELFSELPEAKIKNLSPSNFSFNIVGGRCEVCSGDGYTKIDMQFLSDVYVKCKACDGKRYQKEVLDVYYSPNNVDAKNIADVLDMAVVEAKEFFKGNENIIQKLNILDEVGLGYVKLGQSATTLSGGEAQRVKLATELSRRDTGKTLYILDEPTTGLHFDDIKKLLSILNKLADKGNTVLIIEHNLDIIKSVDHIIDLGPEGGDKGGYLVAQGTPKEVARVKESYTGKYLKEIL